MEHIMSLRKEPFDQIYAGIKTIELRLYDEKRRRISVGDIITFSMNTAMEEGEITVKVEELYHFASFAELYRTLPLTQCGYTEMTVNTAAPEDMNQYYSDEVQRKYGVLGIKFTVKSKYRNTKENKLRTD